METATSRNADPPVNSHPETLSSPEPMLCTEISEQAIRSHIRELKALFSISASLTMTLDWESLLNKIVVTSAQLVNADEGSLMLTDEPSNSLFIASAHNLSTEIISTTRLRLGEGVVGWVAVHRQPLLLLGPVDIEQYPKSFPKPDLVTSSVCVPLLLKNDSAQPTLIGVLSLSRRVGTPNLTQYDLEVVSAFSAHAAAAIHNAHLHRMARKQTAQAQHLIEVSRHIAQSLDTDIVLKSIMDRAVELLGGQAGSLFLVDENTAELVFKVVVGPPASEKLINQRLPLGVGIVGAVAQEGKPLIVNDAKADPRHYGGVDSSTALTTQSILCVPLIRGERVIGVLEVMNKKDGTPFDTGDTELLQAFAIQSAIALGNAQLYSDLKRSFADTVRVITNAVEARDPYTAGHTGRVTQVALEIARRFNWSREQTETLEIGALLHDIGKIGISDKVLHKPDILTQEEYAEMKQHPIVGARMLIGVSALSPMLPYVLYHQERYDGRGYPFGLVGNEIPMEGRLLAVADTFDAMTSDRPYRAGMSEEEAITEITRHRGTQFDPDIVDALLAAYQEGTISSAVQEAKENPSKALHPQIGPDK